MDGRFNNSTFKPTRYSRLLEFEIDDEDLTHFDKVGNRVKFLGIKEIRP
jgi:hypothetical protein